MTTICRNNIKSTKLDMLVMKLDASCNLGLKELRLRGINAGWLWVPVRYGPGVLPYNSYTDVLERLRVNGGEDISATCLIDVKRYGAERNLHANMYASVT